MKILIIEDNEYKFNDIKKSLERVLDSPSIIWKKSKNSGLYSIKNSNVKSKFEPFDLVICDNYMPLYDNDFEIKPYANEILSEIKRWRLEDLPVIVCSSEEIKDCDCQYMIEYNFSVIMDDSFKNILEDIDLQKDKKGKFKVRTKKLFYK